MARLCADVPLVHATAEVETSRLGRYVEIHERCRVLESVVGDYSYMMQDCQIFGSVVGRFVNIASAVRLNATNHPIERATLHHFTYRAGDYFDDAEDEAEFFAARRARTVTVGHDVWIGHGATVLPGVAVGNGAVVGAGAVVAKDVEPYTVVGGVPAKRIRERFPAEIGRRMDRLAWWDWPHEKLRETLGDFRALDAAAFLDRHGG